MNSQKSDARLESAMSGAVLRPKGAITNAAWNTCGTICTIAASFITAPLLIHYLGTSQYGLLLLIGSVLGLLSVMNFGLGEATLRYVARYHAEGDAVGVSRVFGSTLSFYVVVAIVVLMAFAGAAPVIVTWLNIPAHDHRLVASLLRLAALVFAVSIVASAFAVIPLSLQRYDIGTKISVAVTVVRTAGYVALAMSGFGLSQMLSWDLIAGVATLFVRIAVVRRLLPGLRLLPSFSFRGLREIIGYSIFSFLTWAVHTMHRESGKLLLGRYLGMTSVAYLGTPDTIAQRIHMVIASGSEALIPRFSASRDPKDGETLFWSSTWSALALSLMLFIPFYVLVPDFLRLWINPTFARESGVVGQLLALYLISQSTFAPVATYFRGIGKPWFVTVVIVIALLITVLTGIRLIPVLGVKGAAYAYFAGSAAPFLGVIAGGFYAFGLSSIRALLRMIGLPLVAGFVTCVSGVLIRSGFGELNWIGFCSQGVLILSLGAVLIIGGDWLLGGENSPSKQLIERIAKHRRFMVFRRLVPVRPASSV